MKAVVERKVLSAEQEYSALVSLAHRKQFAQFFTPESVAKLMSSWLLGHGELKTVLEPAFGLGIFTRHLIAFRPDITVTGYEIDEEIYRKAKELIVNFPNVNLRLNDYIYNGWQDKYDGIICNPPYFKFHDFDNKPALIELEKHTSIRLNGFTNLYALFLVKSLAQLAPGGRAAYIVPSEFLNSDYGRLVKEQMLNNKTLRHVIVFDFEANVFDDAVTTSSILLFANDDHNQDVRFTNVKSRCDLERVEEVIENYPIGSLHIDAVRYEELDAGVKWRRYYQPPNQNRYKDLIPFSGYAKVSRGIATGSNDYFVFTRSKAEGLGIPNKYLLPCICRSTDVASPFFTEADFKQLESTDRPVFLLNAENAVDSSVGAYLDKGLTEGIDKKYLTGKRNPWYSLEKRAPAPIWVSVFNRNGVKFIRNEANIANLTTFHCIYMNMFSLQRRDLFFAYLLTNVSKEIFEDNRREYGNGLRKFEPNDINNAKMLNLDLVSGEKEIEILNLFKEYRESCISGLPNETPLHQIDTIFRDLFLVD